MSRGHRKANQNQQERRDLQNSPGDLNADGSARSFVTNDAGQRRARQKPAQVRRIIDDAARQKTNPQIKQDHRQHACAEGALETFGQLAPVLQSKDE